MFLIGIAIFSWLLGSVFVYYLLTFVSNFYPISMPVRLIAALFSWGGLSLAVLYICFKLAVKVIKRFFEVKSWVNVQKLP